MFKGIRRLYNLMSGNVYTHVIPDKDNGLIVFGGGYLASDAAQNARIQHSLTLQAIDHVFGPAPSDAPDEPSDLPTEAEVVEALAWMNQPPHTEDILRA